MSIAHLLSCLFFLCSAHAAVSPDELLVLSYEMFAEMRLIDEFQIIPDVLKNFLLTVRSNYHDNPFHNWSVPTTVGRR